MSTPSGACLPGLWFLWFWSHMKWRLMPRDFFQYLVKVCRVFVAAELASSFDKSLRLFRSDRHRLLHSTNLAKKPCCMEGKLHMADPRLQPEKNPMPFADKRLIYDGFEMLVEA
jgi:hypothetical protein